MPPPLPATFREHTAMTVHSKFNTRSSHSSHTHTLAHTQTHTGHAVVDKISLSGWGQNQMAQLKLEHR